MNIILKTINIEMLKKNINYDVRHIRLTYLALDKIMKLTSKLCNTTCSQT